MFLTRTSEELVKRVIEEGPHGRLGGTKDVAPLVGFFLLGSWLVMQVSESMDRLLVSSL